jgi:hypothetical protein
VTLADWIPALHWQARLAGMIFQARRQRLMRFSHTIASPISSNSRYQTSLIAP